MRTIHQVVAIASVLALITGCGGKLEPRDVQDKEFAVTYDSPTVPTCADLGQGSLSFTINPAVDGTHAIDSNNSVDLVTFNSTWFNWTSTLPMGALIIPGGAGAKVVLYGPEITAHGGLSGPTDPTTGAPYPLTSLTFCYDQGLKVILDGLAKAKRTKVWDITKSVAAPTLTLSEGQTYTASYTVVVSQTSISESDWSVIGTIQVFNPTSSTAEVTDVSNLIGGSIQAQVSCGVTFPIQLAAGDTLSCTYSASLPDGSTSTMVATATTSGSVTGGQDQRSLDFAYAAYSYQDTCVTVTDTQIGSLGEVCYDQSPKTFTYSLAIGPYAQCGSYKVDNTATIVANTTGATASSSASVDVDIPCGGGCTLTPGYWKTHSSHGPAPYDATWAQLPAGADTIFFASGQSYYDVLWTAPQGDAYYILAHAFIAAQLNGLNGASQPAAVATAYQAALALLQTTAPGQVTKSNKSSFVSLATILDDYNNGLSGPGHCSEEPARVN